MTQFSNKYKKPCFWPIFGAKKIFLESLALSRTTSYGFLAPCQNFEKVNHTIQRKHPDRYNEGRNDRSMDRPYFIGHFWLLPGVQKIVQAILGKKRKTRTSIDGKSYPKIYPNRVRMKTFQELLLKKKIN